MEQVLSPEIALERGGDSLTLRLKGAVGIMCASELHAAARALADERGPVAIDAAAVEHLDCAAAQILVALQDALAQTGRTAPVGNLGEAPRRYVGIAGLAAPLGIPFVPIVEDGTGLP